MNISGANDRILFKTGDNSTYWNKPWPVTQGLFIWARLTGLARSPGRISPWVHMRKFSFQVSEMTKGRSSWEEFWRKIRKTNKDGETQPSYYYCAYYGFGNPFGCIIAVKQVANDVEIHQSKQNDLIRAALLSDETALLRHRPFNACAIANNSSR